MTDVLTVAEYRDEIARVETNSRGVRCFGDDNQLPRYTRAETRRSNR